jgi:uncharacterized SAM-dependent methyltransferase
MGDLVNCPLNRLKCQQDSSLEAKPSSCVASLIFDDISVIPSQYCERSTEYQIQVQVRSSVISQSEISNDIGALDVVGIGIENGEKPRVLLLDKC